MSSTNKMCQKCLCTTEKLFFCGRCKTAMYCGAVCQKDDWPHHKVGCAELQQTQAENPEGVRRLATDANTRWLQMVIAEHGIGARRMVFVCDKSANIIKRLPAEAGQPIVDGDNRIYSVPLNSGVTVMSTGMLACNKMTAAKLARDNPNAWLLVQFFANNTYMLSKVDMTVVKK